MKLLFMLDEVYGPRGASFYLGWQTARRLADEGCRVTVLQNAYDLDEARAYGEKQGIPVVAFRNLSERALYQYVQDCREAGRSLPRMLLGALAKPRLLLAALRLLLLKRSPVEAAFRRELEALCARQEFDAVVSVSAPHYTAFALAGSEIKAVKAAHMMDPYPADAFKAIYSRRREQWLYNHLDVAFVTEQMAKKHLYPAEHAAQVVPLPFPGLIPQENVPCAEDIALDEGYVNCVFVGGFYLGNREPTALFELFAGLPQQYRLVLVGPGYELFPEDYRARYEALLGERLRVHPPVSQQAAANVQLAADVLINIGNQDTSQLPSKLYAYMSAGLPILNLYQKADCPSRHALARYPLVVHVAAEDAGNPEAQAALADFLAEQGQRRLDFEAVKELYGECTPASVTAAMLAALEAARGKR